MLQLNPIPFLAGAAKAVADRFGFLRGAGEASGQPAARSRLDSRKWTPELLKQLEWRRFEELCAAYYEAQGLTARVAPAGPGGGIDILLHAQGAERAFSIARCKAWDAYRVGARAVRELRAALASAGIGEGVLLTSGRFTQEAADLARKEGIQLVDGAALLAKLAALAPEKAAALLRFATQGDYITPTCPSCSIKMISRQSAQGGRKYWGCRNYPKCKQTFPSTTHAPA